MRTAAPFFVSNAVIWTTLLISKSAFGQSVQVPRMWDDAAMSQVEVPLANPIGSPQNVSADYYYSIPVRPIYKQYPVYAPGYQPTGYIDRLKNVEPVILWNTTGRKPSTRTAADWIQAGELVFNAQIIYSDHVGVLTLQDISNPAWYEKSGMPVGPDGVLPFLHYVIREKGRVELGAFSCAMCHTRVVANGNLIIGAQGSFPLDRAVAQSARIPSFFYRALYAAPWLQNDPLDREPGMSREDVQAMHMAIPPGVLARHRSSTFTPVQVPDLIGVKDRHYLDRTGLHPHRSTVDLMRYAALNQGADAVASFHSFIPAAIPDFKMRPDPTDPRVGGRYSDEQLYALALYLYALKPPHNPNPVGVAAARGREIFDREGCGNCHPAPLYTNNKLTPVEGFTIPPEHLTKYAILPSSVGTDPALTLRTRRGTGYYKVPSLKGVWYRSMFGHSGWCATLEDWFDPKRLREDYLPSGFKPFGAKTYAVKGHIFGLTLSGQDRADLISFLKTL